jgi:uncharacterized protein YggE
MGTLAKSISNVVFQDMITRAAQSPQGQELFPDASRQFLESRGLQNQQPQAASISPIQVQTGAVQQAPQAVPQGDDRRRQMIELLAKQGLDQRQIQTRLADLDDQKFFQSPAERVEETRKVPPRGLLSAGAGETEEEEKQEKPRGILGI